MGMPVADSFRSYLATADSPSHGRDLHHGAMRFNVLQPISHVGDMVPVIAGIALAAKLRGEHRVALTWVGDGSTKAGVSHEGFNLAAVQKVPAIFIVQNNQVALGTRIGQHHLPADVAIPEPRPAHHGAGTVARQRAGFEWQPAGPRSGGAGAERFCPVVQAAAEMITFPLVISPGARDGAGDLLSDSNN